MEPLPYTDHVEQIQPDEDEHIERCIASMHRTNAMTFDLHRRGILRGELRVHDDLPRELAQACSPARRRTRWSCGSRPRPASSTTTGPRTSAGSR